MEQLLYFAYGSNMSTRRLRHRVPSARPLGPGSLAGHRLAWHKKGADGSGKCDIPTARAGDVVYGVIYRIDAAHRLQLDRAEGLGWGYELKEVEVLLLERAEPVSAFTYYAVRTDSNYLPYAWYKDHVLIGAREHNLPADYVRLIENVPAFEDPDKYRERIERELYDTD
jgi:hypothetical protein